MRESRSATRFSTGSFGSRYFALASEASRAAANRGALAVSASSNKERGLFMRGGYAESSGLESACRRHKLSGRVGTGGLCLTVPFAGGFGNPLRVPIMMRRAHVPTRHLGQDARGRGEEPRRLQGQGGAGGEHGVGVRRYRAVRRARG